jgi:lipopolysaccharide transport protein LptA
MIFPLAVSQPLQEIEVRSDKLTLDYDKNMAEYSGNVRVSFNGADITCNKAQVSFSSKKDNKDAKGKKVSLVDTIKFYDNVSIDSKQNQAYSDYGVFTKNNNLVVLEQNVKLKDKSGYVTGSKLVYNAKTKKMRIVNDQGTKRVTAVIND